MTKLWFDEVKTDWQCNRLKTVIISVKNGIWGEEPNNDDNDIECVRIADFDRKKFEVRNKEFTMRNIPKPKLATYLLKQNDLLIEKSGGGEKQPVGFVVQYKIDRPAVYANFMARIEVDESKVNSGFMKYVFSSLYAVKANLRAFNQTTGIQNLDVKVYLNELFVYPSLRDQEYINSFLDTETEYIDELILRKEKLISLLEEKRQSVLAEAITKGINPNVKMKDSGMEWIGEIPEHWNIKSLNHVSKITRLAGYEYTSYWQPTEDGEIVALRGQNIGINTINIIGNEERITESLSQRLIRSRLFAGDVVFPCVGSIGKAACIYEDNKYHINQNIAKLTPTADLDSEFLTYFLNSSMTLFQIDWYNSSEMQPSVLVGNLRKFKIVVPDIQEQKKIVKSIKVQLSDLMELTETVNYQIQKMKDYRQSLIYEAVTGKINVRELVTKT